MRTITVRSTGLPETRTIDVVFDIHAKALNITQKQFQDFVESMTHTKRSTTLEELESALVFAASDQFIGMTGAVLNLTDGTISD